MISEVKLVLDRIFVLQDKGKSEVAGLLIPESERRNVCSAKVVVVGPGWRVRKL